MGMWAWGASCGVVMIGDEEFCILDFCLPPPEPWFFCLCFDELVRSLT